MKGLGVLAALDKMAQASLVLRPSRVIQLFSEQH